MTTSHEYSVSRGPTGLWEVRATDGYRVGIFNTRRQARAYRKRILARDVVVENGGSVLVFDLRSEAAQAFVAEHCATESWQWQTPTRLLVDHRVGSWLAREVFPEHGLTVEWQGFD